MNDGSSQVEQLVKELHAARLQGDLERYAAVFAADARLRIAGSSDGKPIAIDASRIARIRPWLSILVKTFRLQPLPAPVADDGGAMRPPTGASILSLRSPASASRPSSWI